MARCKIAFTAFLIAQAVLAVDEQLNTEGLTEIVRDMVENSLKRGEMQFYLDTFNYEKATLEEGVINSIISIIGTKFERRVQAIKRLQSVVIQAYSKTLKQPDILKCCSLNKTMYDQRFKTQVNTGMACNQISPSAATAAHKISVDHFTNLCIENLRTVPSIKWQYFSSEEGSTLVFPAVKSSTCDVLQSRFRPWYVQANVPTPKQVIIVIDKSGSMDNRYDGVSLMTLTKEAVKSVIAALNPSDKFAVIAFSAMPEVSLNSNGNVSCFSYSLAQASPQNKEKVFTFVDSLDASGGSMYSKALVKAFGLLKDEYQSTKHTSAKRVILFLSDGAPEDSKQSIFNNLNISSRQINNSAVIMTYGIGNADFTILKEIAAYNPEPSKKGQFFAVTDPKQLRNEMVSFYKYFAAEENHSTEPIWTTPYLDKFGIGQVLTGSLPIIIDFNLIGVIGVDFTLEELMAESSNFRPHTFSYSFVISGTGLLINHPLYPYRSDHETLYIYATAFERDLEFVSVYESMKRGENGNKTFLSTRYISSGGSSHNRVIEHRVLSKYIWRKVPFANFSACVTLAAGEVKLHPTMIDTLPANSFVYHRFDLVRPESPCFHLNILAVRNKTTVFFPGRSFSDYDFYLSHKVTTKDVEELVGYLEGRRPNNLLLKDRIRDDVVTTHRAEVLWATQEDEFLNLQKYVLWRYIGTEGGVFRHFPGTQLSEKYDPATRSWYGQALAHSNVNVITTPYLDAQLQAPVISFARALYKRRSSTENLEEESELYGVMGVDISLQYFHHVVTNLYSNMTENYKMYVIDDGGYVVMTDEYINKGDENSGFKATEHLTIVEPNVASKLLLENILERIECALVGYGLLTREYKISMTNQTEYKGKYRNDEVSCVSFTFTAVPGTNAFLLFRSKVYETCNGSLSENIVIACSCSSSNFNGKTCSMDWKLSNECECPCLDSDPHFSFCRSEHVHHRGVAPPCTPGPAVLSEVAKQQDLDNLPTCYETASNSFESFSLTFWILIVFVLFFCSSGISLFSAHYISEIKKSRREKRRAKRKATKKYHKAIISMLESRASGYPHKVLYTAKVASPQIVTPLPNSSLRRVHSDEKDLTAGLKLYLPENKIVKKISRVRSSISKKPTECKISEETEGSESEVSEYNRNLQPTSLEEIIKNYFTSKQGKNAENVPPTSLEQSSEVSAATTLVDATSNESYTSEKYGNVGEKLSKPVTVEAKQLMQSLRKYSMENNARTFSMKENRSEPGVNLDNKETKDFNSLPLKSENSGSNQIPPSPKNFCS